MNDFSNAAFAPDLHGFIDFLDAEHPEHGASLLNRGFLADQRLCAAETTDLADAEHHDKRYCRCGQRVFDEAHRLEGVALNVGDAEAASPNSLTGAIKERRR